VGRFFADARWRRRRWRAPLRVPRSGALRWIVAEAGAVGPASMLLGLAGPPPAAVAWERVRQRAPAVPLSSMCVAARAVDSPWGAQELDGVSPVVVVGVVGAIVVALVSSETAIERIDPSTGASLRQPPTPLAQAA
jgi:hypothetical protein